MKVILSILLLASISCASQRQMIVNKPDCKWVKIDNVTIACKCVVNLDKAGIAIVSIDKCPDGYKIIKRSR